MTETEKGVKHQFGRLSRQNRRSYFCLRLINSVFSLNKFVMILKGPLGLLVQTSLLITGFIVKY